jgi:hypothetical protein
MASGEVRSDLISAYVLHKWFADNLAHVVDGWSVPVNEASRGAAERLMSMMPAFVLVFVTQAPIAKAAIERWGLTDVASLGAGTPTPVSPRPDQVRYYTDANPGAVAEAKQAGYNAMLVDVRNPDDLKKLEGATTLIATGLMHFLPDEAARAMFANIARLGFESFVFNNANPLDDGFPHEELVGTNNVVDQYSKMGMKLHFRSPQEVEALAQGYLQIQHATAIPDLYKGHFLNPFVPASRNIYTVYHTTTV